MGEDSSVGGIRLSRRQFLRLAGLASGAGVLRNGVLIVPGAAAPERVVFPNGLVVIVEERPSTETVAVQLSARAGARYDGPLPGLATLTSRMMFQGTSRYPSETALGRAAAAVGGTLTRGTSVELSSMASIVPSREVGLALDLLSDVASDPLFDPEALERQHRIALQELAQRRTNPTSLLEDLFVPAMFHDHPLGAIPLGTEASLAELSRDLLAANHQVHWSASNLVLTMAGRIRTSDALTLVGEAFRRLPAGELNPAPAVPLPPLAPRQVTGEAGQLQVVFRIGFRAPGVPDEDRYAMTVLNALMADSSGRLFGELRTRRGLVYSAGSAYRPYHEGGTWFAQAAVDPANLSTAIEVTRAEIGRLREESTDEDEVTRRIGQIGGRLVLADESNAAHASRLVSEEILGTDPIDVLLDRIAGVTPADVQRVARGYLDPGNALLVVVGRGLPSSLG